MYLLSAKHYVCLKTQQCNAFVSLWSSYGGHWPTLITICLAKSFLTVTTITGGRNKAVCHPYSNNVFATMCGIGVFDYQLMHQKGQLLWFTDKKKKDNILRKVIVVVTWPIMSMSFIDISLGILEGHLNESHSVKLYVTVHNFMSTATWCLYIYDNLLRLDT